MSADTRDKQRPPDKEAPNPPARRARLSNNVVSLIGFCLVAVGILLILTFGLFMVISPPQNPYVDVIGFLILPMILAAGLIMVPLGIAWKAWRLRRNPHGDTNLLRFPEIDFGKPGHRKALVAFTAANLFVVFPIIGVTSYHGYHYTDSQGFCTTVCHTVMEPQGTTNERSPHARVPCAECHIGSGATAFLGSKLSGTRQVLAVLRDSFPRPIPQAISTLRPARETCEECHWPGKFFGQQLKTTVHYSSDKNNTRREVRMLLETGGADETTGRVEGIHMHMTLAGRIEFVATNEDLQEIPWIKYIDDDGAELIFRSDGKPADEPPPEGITRRIDCMDCHNRAAHLFRTPQQAVDTALEVGRIDPTLPFIKREAVVALTVEYPNKKEAFEEIDRRIAEFYKTSIPDVWEARRDAIAEATVSIQQIYAHSFFPEMKVNWQTYPDNIGHMNSPGCLRCHDGRHINSRGDAISSDCQVCHAFINVVDDHNGSFVVGDFTHSFTLAPHQNLRCDQCHTGGRFPLCRECHESGDWLGTRFQGRFISDQPSLRD